MRTHRSQRRCFKLLTDALLNVYTPETLLTCATQGAYAILFCLLLPPFCRLAEMRLSYSWSQPLGLVLRVDKGSSTAKKPPTFWARVRVACQAKPSFPKYTELGSLDSYEAPEQERFWRFSDVLKKSWREIVEEKEYFFPRGEMRLRISVWLKELR